MVSVRALMMEFVETLIEDVFEYEIVTGNETDVARHRGEDDLLNSTGSRLVVQKDRSVE